VSARQPENWDKLNARQKSKAITSGQRAGERAAQNVWKPYEYEPYDSYDHGDVSRRADAAAAAASFRARERFVANVLAGKIDAQGKQKRPLRCMTPLGSADIVAKRFAAQIRLRP
jgi:hypothetical protein